MTKILLIVVLLGLYWDYKHQEGNVTAESAEKSVAGKTDSPTVTITPSNRNYECDGRTYCSQMNSYEEAKFFLDNCANKKLDGDHDGIPCEKQF